MQTKKIQIQTDNLISKKAEEYGITLIKEGEGCKLKVYKDTKKLQTIGYGHQLLPKEINVLTRITQKEAEDYLRKDIQTSINRSKKNFHQILKLLNPERTAVILDMTFNMGNISKDRQPNFYAALENKDWNSAAKKIMNSKYATQVGIRAKRNACIMRDGKMFTNSTQNWNLTKKNQHVKK